LDCRARSALAGISRIHRPGRAAKPVPAGKLGARRSRLTPAARDDISFLRPGGESLWVKLMLYASDTIAALATPAGTSAIALVRASGPRIGEITSAIFGPLPSPRAFQHADYRDAGGKLIDDVLYVFFAAPNSYSGEDTLEISCHGNPLIAKKILEDLIARGCRPAEAGEFTKRAFLNGRMDLSQAEAVMDLIHAQSERALTAANQQLRGALQKQMNGLVSRLVGVLANIEAYIDFPEEDLPEENRRALVEKVEGVIRDTDRLLATRQYGEFLRSGIKTVILGETNAGKSSLLNRLLGYERALVSSEPGTTRDYLEERINIGAHSLRLVDTAGLNPAAAALERRSIDKTVEQISSADLFLWVIDSTREIPELPTRVAERLTPENTVAIFNKSDLPALKRCAVDGKFPSVAISALLGEGVPELLEQINQRAESLQAFMGDEIIAINVRHAHSLEQAKRSLDAALSGLLTGSSNELIASDLRTALDGIGEITGRIDHERILDQIFSAFCIGK
jgi:tRNA modification GTPase